MQEYLSGFLLLFFVFLSIPKVPLPRFI